VNDLSSEVTVFLLTVGDEANYRDCIAHLEAQTVRFQKQVIDRVFPMSAALQQMLERCSTPYFVQVDEDMILRPAAVERLYCSMRAASKRTALICGWLWDVYMDQPVQGVKIYRYEIVKRFPYTNSFSCEWTQVLEMGAAGYHIAVLPRKSCTTLFGDHGKHYTPETIFLRFQRLVQKNRKYGNMRWLESWAKLLISRVSSGGTTLDWYALLGMAAGIAGEIPADGELDASRPSQEFLRMRQYFGGESGSTSATNAARA